MPYGGSWVGCRGDFFSAHRCSRPGRRRRHPGRARHPQAAHQDRRHADHRAHHRGARTRARLVDEIIVMMAPGHLDAVRAIVADGGYTKVTQILEGADTRNGTTARALARARRRGVQRPVPRRGPPAASASGSSPTASTALDSYEAVDMAIPSADTIIQVDADDDTDRSPTSRRARSLRRGQTPQAFRPSVHPARRTRSPARTRTSPRPTTAPSCCATCPTCRSPSSPATSGT